MKKIILKKAIVLTIILALAITAFAGCGKGLEAPAAEPEDETLESGENKPEEPEPEEPETEPEKETEPEDGTADKEELNTAKIRHKYADILSGVYHGLILPDGTMLDVYDYSTMEDNQFAIADIDGDGREELILEYSSTIMAAMAEYVWDYNPETDVLTEELVVFPGVTFYNNGLVKAGWSHNQGMGPDYWPFSLYAYDKSSDTYRMTASVDSWQKEYYPQDYQGNPFPDEADEDGDGVVYLVAEGESSDYSYMDNAAYEAWYGERLGEAAALELPMEKLSYENVSVYTQPYLDLMFNAARSAAKDTDIALMYIDGGLQSVEDYLAAKCNITVTSEDPEFDSYRVGTLDGQKVISFDYMNATSFYYQKAIDGVSVLGIRPGINIREAEKTIGAYGFQQGEDMEYWYCTGDGMGNYAIFLEVEHDTVSTISFSYYCRYAG